MRRRYNYLLPAYLNCFVWLTYGCLLLGGKQMDVSGWVTLGVGLISVSGVLLTALFQLKRDGKTIDQIYSDSSDIKSTTHTIDSNSSKSKDMLVEIEKRNAKIDALASELEFQERLKQNFSNGAGNRDTLVNGIKSVFEENARLNQQFQEAQEQITTLSVDNIRLRTQHKQDQARIAQLEKACNQVYRPHKPSRNQRNDLER